MPLHKGTSQKTFSTNVSEMMDSSTFASDKNKKKRLAMALAAAYSKKRESKANK